MTMERPNLADAFAPRTVPADRTAGLAGVLPPARSRSAPVKPEAQQQERFAEELRTPPRARPRDAAKPNRGSGATGNVAVYLEPEVLERAKLERRRSGDTYDEIVVRAFGGVTDADLQQAFAPARHEHTGGMPRRQRRSRGTAGIQIQLRMDGDQVAWLTAKQAAVGAPSRSALVATVLRLHLAQPE